MVKNTIDAFDTYRRDNSHLAAYSYPQKVFINPLGQPTTLRYDPRLQGLESLESCFIHQEQAYKTFVNMFRLHLSGVDDSGWNDPATNAFIRRTAAGPGGIRMGIAASTAGVDCGIRCEQRCPTDPACVKQPRR